MPLVFGFRASRLSTREGIQTAIWQNVPQQIEFNTDDQNPLASLLSGDLEDQEL